jgi:hypothetical protein
MMVDLLVAEEVRCIDPRSLLLIFDGYVGRKAFAVCPKVVLFVGVDQDCEPHGGGGDGGGVEGSWS